MSNSYIVIATYRRASPICLASFMDLAKAKQFAHNEANRAHEIYDKSVFAVVDDAKSSSGVMYMLRNAGQEQISIHAVLHDSSVPASAVEAYAYGEK